MVSAGRSAPGPVTEARAHSARRTRAAVGSPASGPTAATATGPGVPLRTCAPDDGRPTAAARDRMRVAGPRGDGGSVRLRI
ncbi:hypothetical protein CD934_29135 [Streptomyces calvus]|uniref:Uncharacterized protein n=1 Tax=Streptomyces calvus TaxID=67282 RepID=A0A514JY35_9ACTN|nr:hypothetical protein CD934_29135 [Streptomyces calvus]